MPGLFLQELKPAESDSGAGQRHPRSATQWWATVVPLGKDLEQKYVVSYLGVYHIPAHLSWKCTRNQLEWHFTDTLDIFETSNNLFQCYLDLQADKGSTKTKINTTTTTKMSVRRTPDVKNFRIWKLLLVTIGRSSLGKYFISCFELFSIDLSTSGYNAVECILQFEHRSIC